MEIPEQSKEHDVTDYDFMFHGGSKFSITVDYDAGDKANELGSKYVFFVAAKKNPLSPDQPVEAETIEVHTGQLAVLAKRNRKQRMPTEEEIFNNRNLIQKLTKTIQ